MRYPRQMPSRQRVVNRVIQELTDAFTPDELKRIIEELNVFVEVRSLAAKGDLEAAEALGASHGELL